MSLREQIEALPSDAWDDWINRQAVLDIIDQHVCGEPDLTVAYMVGYEKGREVASKRTHPTLPPPDLALMEDGP